MRFVWLGEPDPPVDVRLAFARPGRDAGDGVSGLSEFEQRPESESFLQWVDVLALQIFNALGFDCLGIGQLDYADGKVFEFRQFRRS